MTYKHMSEDCSSNIHEFCNLCQCECHQAMKIQQHYHHESGFRFELSIESKDIETHAAMTDLPTHQRELVKTTLFQVGQIVDKLLVANKENKKSAWTEKDRERALEQPEDLDE